MSGDQGSDPGNRQKLSLSTIHVLLSVALVGTCLYFFWKHTPVRDAWKAMSVNGSPGLSGLGSRFDVLWPFVWPDLLTGVVVIGFFIFLTKVYVLRFQAWVKMQDTGSAAAIRGLGIQSQTSDANINRKGGIH